MVRVGAGHLSLLPNIDGKEDSSFSELGVLVFTGIHTWMAEAGGS